MKRGFYVIMAAQFFSSLADNALLIAAIALLRDVQAPAWMTPMLKLFFVFSYVALAAFVGAFADSFPKARVMFITNMIKIGGCMMMFLGVHPLLAYAVVGFGAAAYSPAKYGIVTELLPPEKLVVANGWIEGLTVDFDHRRVPDRRRVDRQKCLSMACCPWTCPVIETGVDLPAEAAISVIVWIYVHGRCDQPDDRRHRRALREAALASVEVDRRVRALLQACCGATSSGQISLAVTTLFWGAGATLQFIVLKWAESVLGLDLARAAILQAVVAVGITMGAVLRSRDRALQKAMDVLPVGYRDGRRSSPPLRFTDPAIVPEGALDSGTLNASYFLLVACAILVLIGVLAGYFVVPMNALLQHRGHVLLSAGHSIAVQNFNENLSILVMLVVYALLIWLTWASNVM